MRVFKFGGASVKNAEGVINLYEIIRSCSSERIVVVVSAMGKTTNALENLLSKAISGEDYLKDFQSLKAYHLGICKQLFEKTHSVYSFIEEVFNDLLNKLDRADRENYDFHYDQIVSSGEIVSTTIIEYYLKSRNCESVWLDARKNIKTDSSHRAANVDLDKTELKIREIESRPERIFATQGFIGSDASGVTTTLGREGSDYSAALFAYALNTEELIIWKDVEGVFNADPKIFKNPKLISHLSYKEAIELAFYGASVIHPKTIQPLSEREIVLKVKSFYDPSLPGTLITKDQEELNSPASVIVKKKQLLLSLVPRNLSFTDLPNMSHALQIIGQHRHQVNLIQNSAVSFSVCLDANVYHFEKLLEGLKKNFIVRYNTDLVLITIRNYQSDLVDRIYENIRFKLEQRNRSTYQVLVDENEFKNRLHCIIDL